MMRTEMCASRGLNRISGRFLACLVAIHAKRAHACIGNRCAICKRYRRQRSDQVRVRARHGLTMRFVAGLTADGVICGIDGGRPRDLTDEPVAGMTAYAGFLTRARWVARRNGMAGIVPLGGLYMMRRRPMA